MIRGAEKGKKYAASSSCFLLKSAWLTQFRNLKFNIQVYNWSLTVRVDGSPSLDKPARNPARPVWIIVILKHRILLERPVELPLEFRQFIIEKNRRSRIALTSKLETFQKWNRHVKSMTSHQKVLFLKAENSWRRVVAFMRSSKLKVTSTTIPNSVKQVELSSR